MQPLYLAGSPFISLLPEDRGELTKGAGQVTTNGGQNVVQVELNAFDAPDLRTAVRLAPSPGDGEAKVSVGLGKYNALLSSSHNSFQVGQPLVSHSTGFLLNLVPPDPPILLHRLRFHVLSFPHLHQGLQISCGGWHVWITSSLISELDRIGAGNSGFHRVTNLGEICRDDDAEFTTADVEEFLEFLTKAFTFVKGGWCAPELLQGFDRSGTEVWQDFALSPSAPINPHLTWFPRSNGAQTLDILNLYATKWNIPGEALILNHLVAIYAEVAGNKHPEELRLLIAQTAFGDSCLAVPCPRWRNGRGGV